MQALATLTLFLPLMAAVLGGVMGYGLPKNKSAVLTQWLTSTAMICAALLSMMVFYAVGFHNVAPVSRDLFTWLELGSLYIPFGLYVDQLSATLMMLTTLISACAHLYAMGYLANDPNRQRFFIYLSLLTFSMLCLVVAPNLVQLFMGWQGVGAFTFLLISFWHHKNRATAAAMKGLVINRIADIGMLMALFILLGACGTVTFTEILPQLNQYTDVTFSFLGRPWRVLDVAAAMLVIAAMGKSAQFTFHTWLGEAMEAPAPASALIYTVTTAAAGIFLLCRMSPLLELTPHILTAVAWVGALTALFGATVALTQKNIKQILAYLTCSQFGVMFFAIGLSAYPAALFHLSLHAFFQSLLFFSAGAVIHALHHETNIFNMGGMRKALPAAYALMWLGALSLVGMWPLAGFFSKDLILNAALSAGTNTGYALYAFALLIGLLTAFCLGRLIFTTFHGTFKGDQHILNYAQYRHPLMKLPVFLLAIGLLSSASLLFPMTSLSWWHGSLAVMNIFTQPLSILWQFLPLTLSLIGLSSAAFIYLKRPEWPAQISEHNDLLYAFFKNKWYVDEAYDACLIRPINKLSRRLHKVVDIRVIDTTLTQSLPSLILKISQKLRKLS